MSIRTFVFEDDPAIRNLVCRVAARRGHEVLSFTEPLSCPVYAGAGCACPQEHACGDILIVDLRMPRMTGLELIEKQMQSGCRGSAGNKAVMSAACSPDELARVAALDCHFFRKPFRLEELDAWLTECEKRVKPGRKLSPLTSSAG